MGLVCEAEKRGCETWDFFGPNPEEVQVAPDFSVVGLQRVHHRLHVKAHRSGSVVI